MMIPSQLALEACARAAHVVRAMAGALGLK